LDESDFKVAYMIKLSRKTYYEIMEVLPLLYKMGTSIEEVSKLFNRDNAAKYWIGFRRRKTPLLQKNDIIGSIK
jgi:hypothetical protein